MHSNKIAIEKVKEFLLDVRFIDVDEEEIEDFYDFSESHKPYFVYADFEIKGVYTNDSSFKSKEEVIEMIKDHYDGRWQNFVIFDVEQNKTVEPIFSI